MAIIEIENLVKSYRVYQKKEGLAAAWRGLFRREYKNVEAVRNVSLRVEAASLLRFWGRMVLGKPPPEASLGSDLSDGRKSNSDGFRALGPQLRVSATICIGDGAEKPLWWDLPAQGPFDSTSKSTALTQISLKRPSTS